MKYFLGLAAAAGLLIWGCARKPADRGAAFDETLTAPQADVQPDEHVWYPKPPTRQLGPHAIPGQAAPEIGPDDNTPDDRDPGLFMPKARDQVYNI